jgi:hypothetical protein
MRRDHLIPPFAEVNPDYDLDVTALLISYCIGDDRDPDEVIDIKGPGDFRVDSKLRDAIRAIPLDSTDDLSTDDLDVQETRIPPQGPGMAYQIEVWLQNPWIVGVATNLVAAGIMAGCNKLWRTYRKTQPAEPNPGDAAAARTHTYALPPPQQQLVDYAKSIVAQHYTIDGDLTDINLSLSESSSEWKFRGTALLSANDGRTFEVSIDYDNDGLRQSRIVRKHSEP